MRMLKTNNEVACNLDFVDDFFEFSYALKMQY